MNSASVKKNFTFHVIETVSAVLFPLIVFPYASRVLLPDGLGQVQFYRSLINYIVLLSSLGIPMYGIREIARVRDDSEAMARTAAEILSLNLMLVAAGYVAVAVMCCFVGKVQENIPLFLVLSSTILFTALGCPWIYRGVEVFRFITIRSLAMRVLALVFLFATVRTKGDLIWYGVYSVIGGAGSSIWNLIELRRRGFYKPLETKHGALNPWRHLGGVLAVFAFDAAIVIYVNLDSVMLGFMTNSATVGYYTAATKVAFLLVTLITSLSAVLMPRASNLVAKGEVEEFARISRKSYELLACSALPIAVGVEFLSSFAINVFCGEEYGAAVLTLQLLAPLILVKGVANMLERQVLYPQGKIRLVVICIGIGIVMNVGLNLVLIPRYAQNGAAVATVVAECCILAALLVGGRKFIPFKIFDWRAPRNAWDTVFGKREI